MMRIERNKEKEEEEAAKENLQQNFEYPYASIRCRVHVCVRARRCVCVSVCYVILSRPQLLSHTQQACWGVQPTGPLFPVSVFLHPLFPPPVLFLRSSYRISTVWIFDLCRAVV